MIWVTTLKMIKTSRLNDLLSDSDNLIAILTAFVL